MSRPAHNVWLNRFAWFTAAATLVLIAVGGLVTSKGVGMAVPDWPTTYGYNMFLFPISKWMGGIFWEHSHRLIATLVGLLVVILTRWLGGREARKPLVIVGIFELLAGIVLLKFAPDLKGAGYFLSGIGQVVILAGVVWINNQPAAPWVQKLGWLAFVLVQVQGLLGGLRVVLLKDEIGIFHAALAQSFFILLCAIALFTSRWWIDLPSADLTDRKNLRGWLTFTTILIFAQLVLGATMRHQHAGLSIPDFPLAYHKLWPPMDQASVDSYNATRLDVNGVNPITAFQILLQMLHRIGALAIVIAVALCAWNTRKQLTAQHPLAKISLAWVGLIVVQIILGASTIWSNKAADVATAHVVVGALSLMTGALLTIISFRVLIPARVVAAAMASPVQASVLSGKAASTNAK